MSIRHDFHLHSDFSADSKTPAVSMIERAIELGLEGMCFTEHEDIDSPDTEFTFLIDFESYFPHMMELREKYRGRIQLGIGMELGFQPHLADVLNALPKKYPFDFVIASCHYVNGKDPYYPPYFEGRKESDCYEEFFSEQLRTLKMLSDYDTLGHMDYVVRYGPNKNKFYSYKEYADYIDPMLRHLIENGKCLELNSGGYRHGLGNPNPSVDILRRYRELGGELVTIGSDAHAPQQLCYDFDKAEAVLTELGFKYYTVFENRKAQQVRI